MSRHFLFVTWDGGGTVPPELSVTRALVERGHRVTVLADPTIEPEASAAGAGFRSWREAPYLVSRRPEDDLAPRLRGPDAAAAGCAPERSPHLRPGRAAGGRDRPGPRRLRPDVVVASAFLLGPQMAAEAEELPVAALLPNIYPFPALACRPSAPAGGPRGACSAGPATRPWRGWAGASGPAPSRRSTPPARPWGSRRWPP